MKRKQNRLQHKNHINWIKCNLPWLCLTKHPNCPDLSDKEREVFGVSLNDLSNSDFDLYYAEEIKYGEREDFQEILEQKADSDPFFKNILKKYRLFLAIEMWLYEQPEIIEWNNSCDKLTESDSTKSFCGLGLNKPGTLIETEDGSQYLIGHINEMGGLTDDCDEVLDEIIIKRYTILFNFD